MSLFDWLQSKSYEKSISNILSEMPPLVSAVRADVSALTDALLAAQDPSKVTEEAMARLYHQRNTTEAAVVPAQKKLFEAIAVWSSLPMQDVLLKLLYPALKSGRYVSEPESHFEAVVVAVYRVWEAAARKAGVDTFAHTPEEVRAIVMEAPDLYT
jgi:hypothetical protein